MSQSHILTKRNFVHATHIDVRVRCPLITYTCPYPYS